MSSLRIAVLLLAGCTYGFNVAEKTRCPPSGVCAEGFSCLGGECVHATRASCLAGDRRCIDRVAWECVDGAREQGNDCAAAGKVCVSGVCLPPCGAANACAPGHQCDPALGGCVPLASCTGAADCAPGEDCHLGACAPTPGAQVATDVLRCYSEALPKGEKSYSGALRRICLDALGGVAGEHDGATFTSATDGTLTLARVRLGELIRARFAAPLQDNASAGVVESVHVGPLPLDKPGERIELVAFTKDDVRTLLATENPRGAALYDPQDRGILIGRVYGCDGRLLSNATVGYSFRGGRVGYLGAEACRRQPAQATTSSGGFVAFDLPIEVPLTVVITARDVNRSLVRIVLREIRLPRSKDPAFPYSVASVTAGRGPGF